jgi:hypothetical protein
MSLSRNPDGRPPGSRNKHTIASVNERLDRMEPSVIARLDRMEALQIALIQSVARGDVPPMATVEQALGAIDFLSAGVRDGKFEEAAATEHIKQLRAFVEHHARSNFLSFASGRPYL